MEQEIIYLAEAQDKETDEEIVSIGRSIENIYEAVAEYFGEHEGIYNLRIRESELWNTFGDRLIICTGENIFLLYQYIDGETISYKECELERFSPAEDKKFVPYPSDFFDSLGNMLSFGERRTGFDSYAVQEYGDNNMFFRLVNESNGLSFPRDDGDRDIVYRSPSPVNPQRAASPVSPRPQRAASPVSPRPQRVASPVSPRRWEVASRLPFPLWQRVASRSPSPVHQQRTVARSPSPVHLQRLASPVIPPRIRRNPYPQINRT